MDQYYASCTYAYRDKAKEVKFNLEEVTEQFVITDPDLREKADAVIRKIGDQVGSGSLETAGIHANLRSVLGRSAQRFLLPYVACTLNDGIKERYASSLKGMQQSIMWIIQKEREVMEATTALHALGDHPDPVTYKDLKENLVQRRVSLAREVLSYSAGRVASISALMSIEDDEERSDVIDAAAVITHSLTAQPDEVMRPGEGERHTPKGMIDAIESLLNDMEGMGLDRAKCRSMHRRAHMMQSLTQAVNDHNAAIPGNIAAVMEQASKQESGAAASVILFDALAAHISDLQKSNPKLLKAAALEFLVKRLSNPIRTGSRAVADLAIEALQDALGQGHARHGNDMVLKAR